MNQKSTIVLFLGQKDFRLEDNPGLYEAIKFSKEQKIPFLPIYILDEGWIKNDIYNLGYPSRFTLAKILENFSQKFQRYEIFLGNPDEIIKTFLANFEVYLFLNDSVEPYLKKRFVAFTDLFKKTERKNSIKILKDALSVDYNQKTGTGNFYKVFTPFKKAVWSGFINSSVLPKTDLKEVGYFSEDLNKYFKNKILDNQSFESIFKVLDQPWVLKFGNKNNKYELNLDEIFARPDLNFYNFSEEENLNNFDQFLENKILNYKVDRDFLAFDVSEEEKATSGMSLALAWGLVSSRRLKQKINQKFNLNNQEGLDLGVETYITELIWREFYKYILNHFPFALNLEFQSKKRTSKYWVENELGYSRFLSFIKGETGFEIVDASVNQLTKTSFIHNRSRMIVSSFLTKNLGVDWRWGQDFFRSFLVDLDEASNNGGWQWGASVGADPKPMRIFNPYLQEQKFDPKRIYISTFLKRKTKRESILDYKISRKEALERWR